jgi:hypothetical protein
MRRELTAEVRWSCHPGKKKPTKQVRSIEAMHANYIAGSSNLRKKFQKTEMNSGIQSSQQKCKIQVQACITGSVR